MENSDAVDCYGTCQSVLNFEGREAPKLFPFAAVPLFFPNRRVKELEMVFGGGIGRRER